MTDNDLVFVGTIDYRVPYKDFIKNLNDILDMPDVHELSTPVKFCEESLNLFRATFKCKRCGKCCQNPVSSDKSTHFIAFHDWEFRKLKKLLTRKAIRKHFKQSEEMWKCSYPCPFYEKGCSVYEDRPLICRVFPLAPPKDGKMSLNIDCPSAREVIEGMYTAAYLMFNRGKVEEK